jgi:hypothetical protein
MECRSIIGREIHFFSVLPQLSLNDSGRINMWAIYF